GPDKAELIGNKAEEGRDRSERQIGPGKVARDRIARARERALDRAADRGKERERRHDTEPPAERRGQEPLVVEPPGPHRGLPCEEGARQERGGERSAND